MLYPVLSVLIVRSGFRVLHLLPQHFNYVCVNACVGGCDVYDLEWRVVFVGSAEK